MDPWVKHMQEIIIKERDAGQRLDKYLRKYMPEAGLSFIYKMLRKKNIKLNDARATGSELLQADDSVKIFFSDETLAKFRGLVPGAVVEGEGAQRESSERADGEVVVRSGSRFTVYGSEALARNTVARQASAVDAVPYESASASAKRRERARAAYLQMQGVHVLYENDHLLFVDKPAGVLSQQDASEALTLNDWVYGYALSTGRVTAEDSFIPSVANRLDRNTSGIVMAAFTYAGSRFLAEAMRDKAVRKYYHAIVEGAVREDADLTGYLSKDGALNKVVITPIDKTVVQGGQETEPTQEELDKLYDGFVLGGNAPSKKSSVSRRAPRPTPGKYGKIVSEPADAAATQDAGEPDTVSECAARALRNRHPTDVVRYELAFIEEKPNGISTHGSSEKRQAMPRQDGREKMKVAAVRDAEKKPGDASMQEIAEKPQGSYVHTRYRVLSCDERYSALEVELITGKSHQIRAHLAGIGHPVAGDTKYGGSPYEGRRMQQLRAIRVEFPEGMGESFGMSGRVIEAGARRRAGYMPTNAPEGES